MLMKQNVRHMLHIGPIWNPKLHVSFHYPHKLRKAAVEDGFKDPDGKVKEFRAKFLAFN